MLIRAIVRNQIKMLNTAAKQSPGKDANTFMLITEDEVKDEGKPEKAEREKKSCWSVKVMASESWEGERWNGRMWEREKWGWRGIKSWLLCEWVLSFSEDGEQEQQQQSDACFLSYVSYLLRPVSRQSRPTKYNRQKMCRSNKLWTETQHGHTDCNWTHLLTGTVYFPP